MNDAFLLLITLLVFTSAVHLTHIANESEKQTLLLEEIIKELGK